MASFQATEHDHATRLLAVGIMPTHIHVVVRSFAHEGPHLLQLFKGAASRRLSSQHGRPDSGTWWTRSGSRRLLTSTRSIRSALQYVREQHNPLLTWEIAN